MKILYPADQSPRANFWREQRRKKIIRAIWEHRTEIESNRHYFQPGRKVKP